VLPICVKHANGVFYWLEDAHCYPKDDSGFQCTNNSDCPGDNMYCTADTDVCGRTCVIGSAARACSSLVARLGFAGDVPDADRDA
jgi:hypothetical protein